MKKIMSVLLAMLLIGSLAACGTTDNTDTGADTATNTGTETGEAETQQTETSSDEVYTVTFQVTFPETSAEATQSVLDQITEASNGRLKFEVYYSYSLISSEDVIDSLQNGTLDMAGFMTSEYPGIFTLNGTMMGLPFLGFESETEATDIYHSMIDSNEAMQKEFSDNGVVYYTSWILPPYHLFLATDKTVTTPDFTGLTLMTENSYMQSMISNYGGAAMASYPPDYYANLNNGVSDGVVQHLNCIAAFGCTELIKNAVIFGGGIYVYPLCYGFSEQFWNSLPTDLQDIFLEYADDMYQTCLQSDVDQLEGNMEALEAEGATITYLTDDEIAVWQDAFADIREGAITSMKETSPEAEEVYQNLVDMIEND